MSNRLSPGGHDRAAPDRAGAQTSTWLWVALGVLLIVRLLWMALMPLADTSEARYADIGRRMLALDDWITPWFDDGVPFWGKPPLHT